MRKRFSPRTPFNDRFLKNKGSCLPQTDVVSATSDDHTGFDSYHECLQEYQESFEVVQICFESDDVSIKDDNSVFEEVVNDNGCDTIRSNKAKMNGDQINGVTHSKSDCSLDDDTITEEVATQITGVVPPSYQHNKDVSTSDEMVFAVTASGLERISFEKFRHNDNILNSIHSDESWKDCVDSNSLTKHSINDNTMLFIDHDVDGYETCVNNEYCSKTNLYNENIFGYAHKVNDAQIVKNTSSFINYPSRDTTTVKLVEYYNDQAECLKEIRLKQRLEDENNLKNEIKNSNMVDKVNTTSKVEKKPAEKRKSRVKNKSVSRETGVSRRKKFVQEPSEESTDLEVYEVSGCHKCFLENYKRLCIAEASVCKFCEVIREILEAPKSFNMLKSSSSPALFALDSSTGSESEDEGFNLMVPVLQSRRKSAEPLRFLVPSRRPSFAPLTTNSKMTVSVKGDSGDNSKGESTDRWGSPRSVTLKRDGKSSLGISIVGGKVDIVGESADNENKPPIFGIFIKNVVQDTPAGKCGQLHTGDRILEVDGVCVRNASHERAVQLIKAAGDIVTLTVQSLVAWQTDSSMDAEADQVQHVSFEKAKTPEPEIKITVTSEPDAAEVREGEAKTEPSADNPEEEKKDRYSSSSDSEDDDEVDNRELEGRTYSEKGIEIDRASAGAIKRSKEEKAADPEEEDDFGYTTNKIKKKYGTLGEVVVAKLERSPKAGLGLSLAGHRDRTRMAVFVCGLNPQGAAAKSMLTIADEILEVNGIVLHGRCHLNASAIIKGLPGPVFKIVVLRRKEALEDLAVKPITQFPVAIEEDPEEKYASYKNVRHITIKKGTSSLGIMIIEGRHQEVGQGIFISDIQEGSPAEQAGLQIGDMILAVNKDCMLGASYDSAASLLKRTEGLVTLTVCNPNKRSESPVKDTLAAPDGTRPATPGNAGAAKPAPSPAKSVKEPPPDPSVAPIKPNAETPIDIKTESKSLGCFILGGNDTFIPDGAVILEIYPDGAAAKDGRLQPGDQILECEGVKITKEMSHERMCLTIKRNLPKIKMLVYRPDPIKYDVIETELARKPGKGLGLSFIALNPGPGAYISELIAGSPADVDAKLQKGDILVSVDGKDVSAASKEDIAATVKSVGAKANIKVKRFKISR